MWKNEKRLTDKENFSRWSELFCGISLDFLLKDCGKSFWNSKIGNVRLICHTEVVVAEKFIAKIVEKTPEYATGTCG